MNQTTSAILFALSVAVFTSVAAPMTIDVLERWQRRLPLWHRLQLTLLGILAAATALAACALLSGCGGSDFTTGFEHRADAGTDRACPDGPLPLVIEGCNSPDAGTGGSAGTDTGGAAGAAQAGAGGAAQAGAGGTAQAGAGGTAGASAGGAGGTPPAPCEACALQTPIGHCGNESFACGMPPIQTLTSCFKCPSDCTQKPGCSAGPGADGSSWWCC